MKTKYLAITVVVLFLLAGLAWWKGSPEAGPRRDGPEALAGKPLVDSALLNETNWIEVSERDGPSVVMIEEDERWILPEYYGIPVEFEKLSRFIRSLRDGKIDRFVTANPERLSRLDLGQARVALKKTGGEVIWEMEIGEARDSGGHFIALSGHEGAFLTQSRLRVETTPAEWASREPLQFAAADISGVTVSFADDSTLRLTRMDGDAPFNAEIGDGEKLRQTKINNFLVLLTEATYRDILPIDDPDVEGAKENSRPIHFTTFDGYDYTVRIGRRPGDPAVVESIGTDPSAVTSSIIFDSDGNIVEEQELAESENGVAGRPGEPAIGHLAAEDGGAVEEEDRDNPGRDPGPVFAFFESSDPKFPWGEPQTRIALRFADYLLEEMPTERSDFIESPSL